MQESINSRETLYSVHTCAVLLLLDIKHTSAQVHFSGMKNRRLIFSLHRMQFFKLYDARLTGLRAQGSLILTQNKNYLVSAFKASKKNIITAALFTSTVTKVADQHARLLWFDCKCRCQMWITLYYWLLSNEHNPCSFCDFSYLQWICVGVCQPLWITYVRFSIANSEFFFFFQQQEGQMKGYRYTIKPNLIQLLNCASINFATGLNQSS